MALGVSGQCGWGGTHLLRDKEGVRAGRHCYRVRIQREEVSEYRDWKTLLQGQNTERGRV